MYRVNRNDVRMALTWRRMSLDRLVIPPQMLRASCQRAYEVLVLKTRRRDSAKLVRLNGAVASIVKPGVPRGKTPACMSGRVCQAHVNYVKLCQITSKVKG